MTTQSSTANEPREVYAVAFRSDDTLRFGRSCRTQECAEHAVSVFEGWDVIGMFAGVILPLAEPVQGTQFALRRGDTPEGALLTPQWVPNAVHINALPASVRDAFRQLENTIHRGGYIGENKILRDQVKQLQAQVAELASIARRALPFLKEAGAEFEDDGANEPLETFRDLSAAVEGIGDA